MGLRPLPAAILKKLVERFVAISEVNQWIAGQMDEGLSNEIGIADVKNNTDGLRLAVIVTEFPMITETFIMRDVIGFKARGFDVRIFHLTPFKQREIVHDFARPALAWAHHHHYLSREVLGETLRQLRTHPKRLIGIIENIVSGCRKDSIMLLKSLFILPQCLRIAKDLKDWRADHVHAAYAGHPATCAWITSRVSGIPFSVSSHAHDIFETRALLDVKLGEAEFVRTISQFNRDYLVRHLPVMAEKPPVVIHVGVLIDEILEQPAPTQDPFSVLYVGSLECRKGVDVLLRALAEAELGNWSAEIVGQGPELKRLVSLAKKLGISDRVRFSGGQPFEEVRRAIEGCSVLVVPSRVGPRNQTEGLPTIIVEALANQRPVIASRLTGIPEIIIDKQTGLLVDVDDASGLAKALCDVRGDPEAAYARAQHGRRLVVAEFDQDRNIAALSDLICGSMKQSAKARRQ